MTGGRLTLSRVTLTFGGLRVLHEIAMEVEPGSVHGLIGPNGAGKTSLLNCIGGFYPPDDGSIRIDGAELVGKRPDQVARHGVARVFQNIELFEGSDVRTNVMLGRHLLIPTGPFREMIAARSVRRAEREHSRRVEEILEIVGLGGTADQPVASLPYGSQKLVELARGLAMEPRVLLLDEPVAGMSAAERMTVSAALKSVRDELGVTLVLIEHDVELVLAIADIVTVLVSGSVLVNDSPDAVRNDERVITAYLGVDDSAEHGASLRSRSVDDRSAPVAEGIP